MSTAGEKVLQIKIKTQLRTTGVLPAQASILTGTVAGTITITNGQGSALVARCVSVN
jgi:hypothetical protein